MSASAAFNVFNHETIRGVCKASALSGKHVFIQTSPSVIRLLGTDILGELVQKEISRTKGCSATLHLDHSRDLKMFRECLERSWKSLMIDGSEFPLEENIRFTRSGVSLAHEYGAKVEGELGVIPGEEDDIKTYSAKKQVPALEDIRRFVEGSDVDSLAIAIGNQHGRYLHGYDLDFSILQEVHSLFPRLPLVLHGGSGLDPADIQRAVGDGVFKVNFSTELKECYFRVLQAHATEGKPGNAIDFVENCIEEICQFALGKIRIVSGRQ